MKLFLETLVDKSGTGGHVSHGQLAESINRMQRVLDVDDTAEPVGAHDDTDLVFGSLSPTTLPEIRKLLKSQTA